MSLHVLGFLAPKRMTGYINRVATRRAGNLSSKIQRIDIGLRINAVRNRCICRQLLKEQREIRCHVVQIRPLI